MTFGVLRPFIIHRRESLYIYHPLGIIPNLFKFCLQQIQYIMKTRDVHVYTFTYSALGDFTREFTAAVCGAWGVGYSPPVYIQT